MAFGGFFGGGSNSGSDKSSSSSSPHPDSAAAQGIYPVAADHNEISNFSSSDVKSKVTTALSTQSNIMNAKILISKINENCFNHCVPTPGTSLSKGENQCLSACMEKYIDGWNVVSKTYVGRLQREGAQLNIGGGM